MDPVSVTIKLRQKVWKSHDQFQFSAQQILFGKASGERNNERDNDTKYSLYESQNTNNHKLQLTVTIEAQLNTNLEI